MDAIQMNCSDSAVLKGRNKKKKLNFSAYLCGHDLPPVKAQKSSSDFAAHGQSLFSTRLFADLMLSYVIRGKQYSGQ